MGRSTRAEIDRQLDLIEQVVRTHPGGVGLPEVAARLMALGAPVLDQRTLQRRLVDLAATGRIRAEGEKRGRRYFPRGGGVAPEGMEAEEEEEQEEQQEEQQESAELAYEGIPLSAAASEALALIRAPLAVRRPVGYEDAFILGYDPGRTWYLPEPLRRQLHDAGRTPEPQRPAGTYAREVFERLLIDLAWASSRLEGNTYDRLDTRNLLEHGVRAEGKDAAEAQMILNHKKAIELLVNEAEEVGFNRHTFLNLHAALSENLLGDPREEGRVRTRMVQITGTVYTPLAIPQKLDELFSVLLSKASAIPDPFEQAFFVMVQLPYLQPFVDVNKRTSRLGANLPLIKANLCPLSFVGVPERAYIEATLAVYEFRRIDLLRDLFAWAYERSCEQYRVTREALGQPDPIRLRYRAQLGEVVRQTVLELHPPRRGDLQTWAEAHGVPSADRDAFTDAALGLLMDLHEGSIARYELKPSEFRQWKASLASTAAANVAVSEPEVST